MTYERVFQCEYIGKDGKRCKAGGWNMVTINDTGGDIYESHCLCSAHAGRECLIHLEAGHRVRVSYRGKA